MEPRPALDVILETFTGLPANTIIEVGIEKLGRPLESYARKGIMLDFYICASVRGSNLRVYMPSSSSELREFYDNLTKSLEQMHLVVVPPVTDEFSPINN